MGSPYATPIGRIRSDVVSGQFRIQSEKNSRGAYLEPGETVSFQVLGDPVYQINGRPEDTDGHHGTGPLRLPGGTSLRQPADV